MPRKQFIDLAKGFTIVCVVFLHGSLSTDNTYYYYKYLKLPSEIIYSFIMPLFFMVSATFLRKRLENNNFSASSFLKNVTSTILRPFYIVNFIFVIIIMLAPKSLGLPVFQEMSKALLFMQSNEAIMPSGIMWFLFVLFAFALITFIFIKIFKINIYLLLMLSVLLKMAAPYLFYDIYYFAFDKISQNYIYYVAGYWLSEQIYTAGFISRKTTVISLFILWLLTFYVTFIAEPDYVHHIIVMLGSAGIFGSLLIVGSSYNLYNIFPSNGVIKFLCFCGANSILIYVFHNPTFIIVRKIMHVVNISNSIWEMVIVVVCGCCFPLIYGKILGSSPAVYRFVFGRNP